MITLPVKPEWRDEAFDLYDFHNLKNSKTKGQSQIYGAIGEICAKNYLNDNGIETRQANTYDYDLIIVDNNGIEKTIDVKTKKTSVYPEDHFQCSIYTYYKQTCDYYMFLRVSEDQRRVHIIGAIESALMHGTKESEDVIFYPKGSVDPNSNFGIPMKYKDDNYCITVGKLKKHNYLNELI